MIVAKECVGPSGANVALKNSMSVKATNNSRCRGIRARRWRLATNTKQIGDQVAIDQVCGVSDKYSKVVPHVEDWNYKGLISKSRARISSEVYSKTTNLPVPPLLSGMVWLFHYEGGTKLEVAYGQRDGHY
jgi:hypothetical protein